MSGKQYNRPMLTGRPARMIPRADGLVEFRDSHFGNLLCLFDPRQQVILIQKGRERSRCELPLDNKSKDVVE